MLHLRSQDEAGCTRRCRSLGSAFDRMARTTASDQPGRHWEAENGGPTVLQTRRVFGQ